MRFGFLGLLLSAVTCASVHEDSRDIMIYLYDCDQETVLALANQTESFTIISPPLGTVANRSDGEAEFSLDATFAKSCADRIFKAMPRVKLWPWITHCQSVKPPGDANVMRALFASPKEFVANATKMAKAIGVTGWNIDFEATGEAPNVNETFWQESLRFFEYFAVEVLSYASDTEHR